MSRQVGQNIDDLEPRLNSPVHELLKSLLNVLSAHSHAVLCMNELRGVAGPVLPADPTTTFNFSVLSFKSLFISSFYHIGDGTPARCIVWEYPAGSDKPVPNLLLWVLRAERHL
jgi:hypothetical protein